MRRLPPSFLALVLGVLAALAVACGDDGEDRRLLSPSRAEAIREELDKIRDRVDRGECGDLQPAFVRLERAVDELPRATDRRLRRRLGDGVAHLERISPEQCRENRPETTETTETGPPETTTTAPETTTTPPETETVPPETEPDDGTPPETIPDDGTPPETIPPEDTGGDQAPGASFTPPGQAKKDGKG